MKIKAIKRGELMREETLKLKKIDKEAIIEKRGGKEEIIAKKQNENEKQPVELPQTILQTDSLVFSTSEVSKLIGVSPITLYRWRKAEKKESPKGPPWAMIGGKVFYHKEGLSNWFDAQFNK